MTNFLALFNFIVSYGYGGFEISMLPFYASKFGAGWLERGGVFALANIRGGGEFGPSWHQQALKANRHKAYEDFEAVAVSLVENKICSVSGVLIFGLSASRVTKLQNYSCPRLDLHRTILFVIYIYIYIVRCSVTPSVVWVAPTVDFLPVRCRLDLPEADNCNFRRWLILCQ